MSRGRGGLIGAPADDVAAAPVANATARRPTLLHLAERARSPRPSLGRTNAHGPVADSQRQSGSCEATTGRLLTDCGTPMMVDAAAALAHSDMRIRLPR